MQSGKNFIGVDLGAESGRILLGALTGEQVSLSEVMRFPIFPVTVRGYLYWDILNIWSNIINGMRKAGAEASHNIAGIGMDSWALDFGLLDAQDNLLGNPFCYRDTQTDNIVESIKTVMLEEELFEKTGLSYLNITTLGQLLTMKNKRAPMLSQAKTLLMLPNLLSFWLTGIKVTEVTIAGNTQLLNLHSRTWDAELVSRFELPAEILSEVVPSATTVGELLPNIAQETGFEHVPFIATACHDTASAAAAAPIGNADDAIISCGTWSVIGKESPVPILSREAREKGYHNIQGACQTYYFANYSIGLWLLQEYRRELDRAGSGLDYSDLTRLAQSAAPFRAVINPDEKMFFHPGTISEKIRDFCRQTDQVFHEDKGFVVRTILEGLALRYKNSIADLEKVSGRPVHTIHIIGGGSRNELLCQFTADATQKSVVAGPAEATGAANILLQAMALGQVGDLTELRAIVKNSFALQTYTPGSGNEWEQANRTFSNFPPLSL